VTTLKIALGVNAPTITHGADQVPFAMGRAILAVLKTGQKAQVEHMGRVFTIRRKNFARLSVKITGFPNKNKPVGEIAIQSPGGRSDIFSKFEHGGLKIPHEGRSFIAVPRVGSLVKRRKSSIVPEQLRPAALRDNPLLTLRTFVKPFKKDPSKLGLFAVDRAAESRVGAGRRAGKVLKRDRNRARPSLLYTLIAEAPIQDTLDFVKTMTDTVSRDFGSEFEREFANALRTRR
jgi:hypothetical protein